MRLSLFFSFILALPAVASAQSSSGLEFGGQFRARGEMTNVSNYATQAGRIATDFVLYRTRLSAKAEPGQGLQTFIELQDSRTSGSTPGTNNANVDLNQAYLDVRDIGGLPLEMRAGRFGLKYGDQRLISTLEWSNVGRSWDGLRLRTDNDKWTADLFVTNVKEVDKATHDHLFSGLYATCKAVADHEMDAYLLARDLGDGIQVNEGGGKGNLTERTLGTRLKGKTGYADYSGEAVYQFGFKAGNPIQAHAFAGTLGWNFPVALKPRLGFEWDYASGDANPTDGKVGTFSPLFPFGHFYQGHADVFSWRNGHDFNPSLQFTPAEGWKGWVSYHHFRTVHTRDSWYGATGSAIATDAAGASGKHVGDELDIHFKTKFRDAVNLWFGAAHFIPGNFAKNTVAARDKTFGFLQAVINF